MQITHKNNSQPVSPILYALLERLTRRARFVAAGFSSSADSSAPAFFAGLRLALAEDLLAAFLAGAGASSSSVSTFVCCLPAALPLRLGLGVDAALLDFLAGVGAFASLSLSSLTAAFLPRGAFVAFAAGAVSSDLEDLADFVVLDFFASGSSCLSSSPFLRPRLAAFLAGLASSSDVCDSLEKKRH